MRHSPLALWHLLSLDAPTVAALWTWFVARCCGVALPAASVGAMFLAVWLLYASDRLLDAQNADHETLEERHRFHHRHRRVFVFGIAVAGIALAVLTRRLLPEALHLYALLGALLATWFLAIHTRLAGERRLPKELAVGLFFAAAIFIPTVARRPDLRPILLPSAALFATVCSLNCMYLYAWEHPGSRFNANWTTRFATGHLRSLSLVILAASLLCALAASPWQAPDFAPGFRRANLPIGTACALAAALFLLLDGVREKLSPVHVRAAADLALLTPLLVIPFAR